MMGIKIDVLSAEQMKRYDSNTIGEIGIPAVVLMERAALALADASCSFLKENGGGPAKILLVCGCGNNGADGLAAARILSERGNRVTAVVIGNREKCSELNRKQREILSRTGISVLEEIPDEDYDLIVDALFGIGLSRNIEEIYKEALEKMDQMNGYKISADIPSGICADSGQVLGTAVHADETVTFAFLKKGLCLYPGRSYAGKVSIADIGIGKSIFCGMNPDTFTFHGSAENLLPERPAEGHKGTFGKLLMVVGSRDMAGAALLSAEAAYRTGAGMVKIVTCEENRVIIQERLPEALLLTYGEESQKDSEWLAKWKQSVEWADACVIGCGCGQGTMISFLLKSLFELDLKPLVLDADALNLIASDSRIADLCVKFKQDKIFTPHQGELARLMHETVTEVKEHFPDAVRSLSVKYGAVAVGKDAVTTVMAENEKTYLNVSGNCGMATAGSGDVLSGMIGALLIQKESAYNSSWKAVYLHGMAGDLAAEKTGIYSLTASEILKALPDVINGGLS